MRTREAIRLEEECGLDLEVAHIVGRELGFEEKKLYERALETIRVRDTYKDKKSTAATNEDIDSEDIGYLIERGE